MTLPTIAICVPVRNEEAVLPGLLAALARLDTAPHAPVVCFHLDNCGDRSEAIVRDAAPGFPLRIVLNCGRPGGDPNAGRARHAAMALGLAQVAGAEKAVLLSTDADSAPQADWIAASLHALSLADIAAGRMVRQDAGSDPTQTRIERYYDRLYALRRAIDPVAWDSPAGHHFTGGANLAFRASAYRALGGFRPLPCAEDATMLDDARRAGFRVRQDPAMVVHTSSRRQGRAPGGLAAALLAIDRAGLPRVAHPAAAVWQYRAQAEARATFAMPGYGPARQRLADMIGLDADHVLGVARDCPNAEAFAMRLVPAARDQGIVSLAEAEEALGAFEAGLIERAA